jgi:hypothetical protein
VIRQFVETNFKTFGSLAVPTKALDSEIAKMCDGVKLDIEVIS